jgi:hypothetical protein
MEDVAGKVRDDSMDMDRTIGQRSCAMAAMGSCEAPKQRLCINEINTNKDMERCMLKIVLSAQLEQGKK